MDQQAKKKEYIVYYGFGGAAGQRPKNNKKNTLHGEGERDRKIRENVELVS